MNKSLEDFAVAALCQQPDAYSDVDKDKAMFIAMSMLEDYRRGKRPYDLPLRRIFGDNKVA